MKDTQGMRYWLLLLLCLPGMAWGQYNLEEMGFEAGPGFTLLQNRSQNASGAGGNANVFYSHYACGKGYGFHVTAGATGLFPSTPHGENLIDLTRASKASFQFAGIDLGFLGKLRIHEYHRPSEWAVFLGPKLLIPLLTRTDADPLKDNVQSVSPLWTGAQLSVQFRRPVSKKKSWFIRPGVEYFFLPAFNSRVAGDARPLYFFLNFGYAFWDQRG
jgi:hypothetical protein